MSKDPEGTTYILDGSPLVGGSYLVKRVLPGQDSGSPDLKVVFKSDSITEAGAYRDSLMGGPPFHYERRGY